LSAALEVGIRADGQGSALVDYHTVEGGVLAATGKVKINASTKEPETVVSWRHYLCDATFLVVIQGPEQLIRLCAEAVLRPVWPPYLGRKSCPPTRPLYEGEGDYGSLQQALELWPRLVEGAPGAPTQLLAEVPAPFGEGLRRSDELVSRSRRLFAHRSVRQVLVDPPSRHEEVPPCTSPS
jgi:CRISPR system Cascade subunit CasD